jgi:hypothetical protein
LSAPDSFGTDFCIRGLPDKKGAQNREIQTGLCDNHARLSGEGDAQTYQNHTRLYQPCQPSGMIIDKMKSPESFNAQLSWPHASSQPEHLSSKSFDDCIVEFSRLLEAIRAINRKGMNDVRLIILLNATESHSPCVLTATRTPIPLTRPT